MAPVITAAPDAGGPLSYRSCPTLAEARAAVPSLVSGPDVNGVPSRTMVFQCNYSMNENDILGRPAGIGILVVQSAPDGAHLWDGVRTDSSSLNPTDTSGPGDVALSTGSLKPTMRSGSGPATTASTRGRCAPMGSRSSSSWRWPARC